MFAPHSRPILMCLLVGGLDLLSSTYANAQSASPAAEPLEEVVVVGSRIPQTQDQTLPITIITSQQLEQRGYATVQQALDALPQNSGGGFDQQLTYKSFTPSAAALNLRDLGVGRALILLDGRRMPMFPVGFNGTDSFVDVSSIPIGAIERIEVLPDGASAIYGSDAMAGVVNIVLKKQVSNEVSLRYGDTTQGGGAEKRVQLSGGAQADTSKVLLMLEYYQRDRMMYSQRERTRSDRLGGANGAGPGSFSAFGYPGTFTDASESNVQAAAGCIGSPGVVGGVCMFDRAPYREIWPDITALSGTAKFDQELTTNLSWFVSLMLRNNQTKTQMEPQSVDALYDLGVVVPGNPYPNGSYLRRLVELGPQRATFDTDAYVAVTGLTGRLTDRINWEFDVQSAQQSLRKTDYGQVLSSTLADAAAGDLDFNGDGINDPLNLTQRIPDSIAVQLEYRPVSLDESSQTVTSLQLNGDLFSLPAGPAKFAATAEYIQEHYFNHTDPELVAGHVLANGGISGEGKRGHDGFGVELRLPLLSSLNLNVAGRYDGYHDQSDVGSAISPRISLEYRPLDGLLLHAAAGRSFRAPDLQRMFGGSTSGYQLLVDTPTCIANGGTGRGDPNVPSCINSGYVAVTTGANRHLEEERGKNFSAGVAWRAAQFETKLDYFAIDLRQLVQTPDAQFILDQSVSDSSYAAMIKRGQCQYTSVCMTIGPRNIAYKKVSGLDFSVNNAWPETAIGRFSTGVSAAYLLKVEMRESAFRAPVDVLRDGQLGEATRLKGGVDLGWNRGQWASSIFVDYIGGFTPLNTTVEKHLGSFTTVNWSVQYTLLPKSVVQLGVNNLFNRMPPVDIQSGNSSQPFYHQQFHNVDGASWYASYRQGF